MVDLSPLVVAPVIDVLPLRIGVLGGTFDPVHIGHLRGGLEVAELMQLDELRLTPNARPPHRDTPRCRRSTVWRWLSALSPEWLRW